MKKSYICEKIGKTLNFLPDEVSLCCSYAEGARIKFNSQHEFNMDNVINTEKSVMKELKHGNIPKSCNGCIDYTEKQYKNIFSYIFSKDKFDFLVKDIFINHFTQCDCNCIYCTQKFYYNNGIEQQYELLPIIKQLYKNNLIDKNNLRVEFQGGNVSVLNEFEPLINEFLSNGCRNFYIQTNGIKYLPIIEETSNAAIVGIQISLDCGTKETFEKIKQVDAFEQVIENIKKFSTQSNAIIDLKYIIINGINDNLWEVSKFLETVQNLRCVKSIFFDIDFRDILIDNSKNFKVPEHYKDIIKHAQTFCDENRIKFAVAPLAQKFIDGKR